MLAKDSNKIQLQPDSLKQNKFGKILPPFSLESAILQSTIQTPTDYIVQNRNKEAEQTGTNSILNFIFVLFIE